MRADGVGGGRSGFSAATAGRAPLAAAGSVSAARNGGPWTRAFTRSRDARLDLDLRRAAEREASFSARLSLSFCLSLFVTPPLSLVLPLPLGSLWVLWAVLRARPWICFLHVASICFVSFLRRSV